MTLLLALLMMNEHYSFPKIYENRMKYFYDDYDSQGLENYHESYLFCSEIFNQPVKTDSDYDECL